MGGVPPASVAAADWAVENLTRLSLSSGTWSAYVKDWDLWEACRWSLGIGYRDLEMVLLVYIWHCRENMWSMTK